MPDKLQELFLDRCHSCNKWLLTCIIAHGGRNSSSILIIYTHKAPLSCQFCKSHLLLPCALKPDTSDLAISRSPNMGDRIVWVASLGYIRNQGRRVYVPQEARTEALREVCDVNEFLQPNTIFGALKVQQHRAFDIMRETSAAMDVQIQFWERLIGSEGRFVEFHIADATPLVTPTPLLELADRKLRGFVVELEPGQAERLWKGVAERFKNPGSRCPGIAIRLAPQHAALCVHRVWRDILLPDLPRPQGQLRGSQTLNVDWVKLNMPRPQDIERLGPQHIEWGSDKAKEIIVILRRHALSLQDTATDDDTKDIEYNRVVGLVKMMTDMVDQLDPSYLQLACRDLQSRASLRNLGDMPRGKIQYRIAFLMQVLLMSDSLRDSKDIGSVLRHALEMVVPPVLLPQFKKILQDASATIPHKATVSRWKFLLDGAIMCAERNRNKAQEYLRWIMADSSTQHGRTFQLVATLNLTKSEAANAYLIADELANLWYVKIPHPIIHSKG